MGEVLERSWLSLPDGIGMVWGIKKRLRKKINRLSGVDWIDFLFKKDSGPYYFLGAKEFILDQMINKIRAEKPSLKIAGYHHGYFKKEELSPLCSQIIKLNPKFVLVAMGSPIQEEIILRLQKEIPHSFFIPCGGSFDVLSGHRKRAPLWIQNLKLEWLYRIVKQPFRVNRLGRLLWFWWHVIWHDTFSFANLIQLRGK